MSVVKNINRPITQQQAADILGVTLRHFQRIIQEPGAPPKIVNADGRASGFGCGEYGKWLRSRFSAEMGVGDDGKVYDEKLERARLLHHQANNESLKEEVNRRELLRASDVESAWSDMVVSFRSKLLGLPSRAAHVASSLQDPKEIEDLLSSIVNEALHELADFQDHDYMKPTIKG